MILRIQSRKFRRQGWENCTDAICTNARNQLNDTYQFVKNNFLVLTTYELARNNQSPKSASAREVNFYAG